MTEAEKRERRALERKLSEMEEELKVSPLIDFHALQTFHESAHQNRDNGPIPLVMAYKYGLHC